MRQLVTPLGIRSAHLLTVNPVRPQARNETGDLLFKCQQCASPLVVNAAAAGMTLNCQRCGKPTLVPMVSASAASGPQELTDLQRKLKENESQRTEITSYINQLSIQLHRWKLRLQTLNERKTELEEELRKTT
jgi:hypothetical protein